MAALSTQQYQVQWWDGLLDRSAVYSVKGANDGDTIDVSDQFREVRRAAFVGASVDVVSVCTSDDTVITLPNGLDEDAGLVTIYGVAV